MLRKVVQVIGIAEGVLLLAIVVLAITSDSDPAGDAMASAFGTLAALALGIFVVPALWAARKDRFLWPALALVLVPIVLLLVSMSGFA